jgi:predicted transcriptional regulator
MEATMGRNDTGKVTDAELDVLNILWQKGPSTVRDVHTVLTSLRDIRYTTTLKTLQVMTGKGLVKRDVAEKAHIYEAAVDHEKTQREMVGDLVNRVFSGSAVGLMAGALSGKKTSPEELTELRHLLDQAEEDNK